MRVNIISESVVAKEQGVHTAFLTTIRLAKKKGLTVLTNSLQRADITHIHTLGPFGLLALKLFHPVVVTAHVVPESLLGSLKGDKVLYALSKHYFPWSYNAADLVLAVSPLVKERLLTLGVTSRIEVFPNPVDEEAFRLDPSLRKEGRKFFGFSDDAFVVIASGQVQPRKGISDFIRLAQEFPDISFVWVGGKPFKSITADDAEMNTLLAHPPKNFFLQGPFTYAQMPSLYNAADIFVFPSFQENASMSIIEAAACGLPLILRDNPEYKVLYDKEYIACSSFETFKKQIQQLRQNKKIYNSARKSSLILAKKYAIDTLGDSLIRYYQSLL